MQQNQGSSILSEPKEGKGKETGETCKEVGNRKQLLSQEVVSLSPSTFLYLSSYIQLFTCVFFFYYTDVTHSAAFKRGV